ncbi:BZIP domain-containing protein [Meloidogyne graminicola]|uniref:BZIP domain-containing protein n=1 Tax=Meloidogyne graminicola TaxID=189291 RepID=A0A8S9ZQR2_9BILA|nr:BZIP domain-containing protein [Meloidogyne graminicola]
MSHSYSNHQRMNSKPPNTLSIRNFDGNTLPNGGGFVNGNGLHSWQTDQTINLENINLDEFDNEHFNLLNFITDGSSPNDEAGSRLDDDEIQKQKAEALYAQYQYDQIMFSNPHLQQRNGSDLDISEHLIDLCLSSDFGPNDFGGVVSVPSSCFGEVDVGPCRGEEKDESLILETLNNSTLVPSTSSTSMQKLRLPIVKEEPYKDEPLEQDDGNIQVFGSSSSRASSVASSGIYTSVLSTSHSSATPRKYRIKSDKEKSNPMYRLKRLKNNDAVRRSRDKARQQQMAKEHRLLFLEHETREQAVLIEELKAKNADLQEGFQKIRQNCRCGAASSIIEQRH